MKISDFLNHIDDKVKLTDIDGKVWEGILGITTDYDTDTDYILVIQESVAIQFDETEIEAIEIVEF